MLLAPLQHCVVPGKYKSSIIITIESYCHKVENHDGIHRRIFVGVGVKGDYRAQLYISPHKKLTLETETKTLS